jgi:hypothetical protein
MEHPSEEGSIDSEKKNVLPKLSYFLKVTQLASGSTGTCLDLLQLSLYK